LFQRIEHRHESFLFWNKRYLDCSGRWPMFGRTLRTFAMRAGFARRRTPPVRTLIRATVTGTGWPTAGTVPEFPRTAATGFSCLGWTWAAVFPLAIAVTPAAMTFTTIPAFAAGVMVIRLVSGFNPLRRNAQFIQRQSRYFIRTRIHRRDYSRETQTGKCLNDGWIEKLLLHR
jgi:hypothetical protein